MEIEKGGRERESESEHDRLETGGDRLFAIEVTGREVRKWRLGQER